MHKLKWIDAQGTRCLGSLIVRVVLNYLMGDSSFNRGQLFFYGESSNESSSEELFDTIENLSSSDSSDIFGTASKKEWKPLSPASKGILLLAVLQSRVDFNSLNLLFCKFIKEPIFFVVFSLFASLASSSIYYKAFVKNLFLAVSFLFKPYSRSIFNPSPFLSSIIFFRMSFYTVRYFSF